MHVLRFKFQKVPWWFWNGTVGLVCTAHLKQGQQGCSFSAATWWLTQGGVNGNCSRPTKRQTASKDRSHRGALIEVCCRAVDTINQKGSALHFPLTLYHLKPATIDCSGLCQASGVYPCHYSLSFLLLYHCASMTIFQCFHFFAHFLPASTLEKKCKTKTLKTKPTNTGA